jgi:glyoxylase-like metal-dependent hydrolase (beta-lactamase superfamily II)
MSRRELIQSAAVLAGTAFAARAWPGALVAHAQQPAPAVDQLAAMRAQLGATPIEATKLTDTLTLLSGPGGNVVVLHGEDGKVVLDTFVQPAWPRLKELIDAMSRTPLRMAINTHWHFDHSDNNANFRQAGARIIAHENTRKRLSEPHDLMGMHLEPAPADALPTETFATRRTIDANGEVIELVFVPPAHTDTDVYARYARTNLVHMGDLFFNGMYPFIDAGTGGRIGGMISAADVVLKMTDASTRIVPGHGPLGDRAALTQYRDMLVTVRDRVQKLKSAGRPVGEVVAAKPTADLDAVWGKGFMQPDPFVTIVYNTL